MSTVTEGGLRRLGKAQKEEGERRSAHHAVFVDGHNLRLISNEYKSAGRVLRAHDRRREPRVHSLGLRGTNVKRAPGRGPTSEAHETAFTAIPATGHAALHAVAVL